MSARNGGRGATALPLIPDDEKPFDIPESWEWVRLGEVIDYRMGKTPPRADLQWWSPDIPWVSIADMPENGHVLTTKERVSRSAIENLFGGRVSEAGTLLMSFKLTVGRVSILDIDAVHNEAIISIFPCHDEQGIFKSYLFLILPFVTQFGDSKSAIKGKTLNSKSISNLPIPLPPLAEQKRIVAKIEELLPLIDRYEKAWSKLEDFNKRFPVDMQKSVLQMAIQGKLVDQRPEEGTGEELYRQIQAEKQRLVKSGKIKKEKPLPEITEDEITFEIPDSWKWARLSKIAKAIVDCPHSTPKYLNLETEYCTIDTNCINEKGEIIKWRYVDAGTYQVRIARLVPQKDDIVYTREGSICRAAQLPDNKNICLGQRVMLVRCAHGMFPQFLRRMLMSPAVITKLTEQQKGIGAKHVNVSDVCNLLIPLPPFAEQKRIVAKLEELLPLCERLKGSVPL